MLRVDIFASWSSLNAFIVHDNERLHIMMCI